MIDDTQDGTTPMHDKDDGLADLALDRALRAAFVHQRFIAFIVSELCARNVLPLGVVARALNYEKDFIEDLRQMGQDPRMEANAFEQLVALLDHNLAGRGRALPKDERKWRKDPADPAWPGTSKDTSDWEIANQP